MGSKTMPGYSIPPAGPATLIATVQGTDTICVEKRSTECFEYSVERSQFVLASSG